MMKRLGVVICMALFIGGNSSATGAYCLVPDVTRGLEQAKAVFVGEVEEIVPSRTTSKDAPFFERAYVIQFKIEKSWKGMPFGWVKVWALQGGETFALPRFNKGERYLVYADPVISNEVVTDELKVDECNRTALLPKGPQPRRGIMDAHLDRENGARDLRILNGLMLTQRRRKYSGQ